MNDPKLVQEIKNNLSELRAIQSKRRIDVVILQAAIDSAYKDITRFEKLLDIAEEEENG